MQTDSDIAINAPAPTVWAVFTDVERWPTWTASVTALTALDGPELEVGRRFEIKQPRMPNLVWVVTELEPGRSWTWEQRSPGGRTTATHWVEDEGDGTTVVRQRLVQGGPVGALVGRLSRGLTRRYLDLEANGLKAASERRHLDATAS